LRRQEFEYCRRAGSDDGGGNGNLEPPKIEVLLFLSTVGLIAKSAVEDDDAVRLATLKIETDDPSLTPDS
jgi:hypothetical protein